MAIVYHMSPQNDVTVWEKALGMTGRASNDAMPLAVNAPAAPASPPAPVAGGLADSQTFDLRSYPGTPEAAVYELLRSGASHAWLQAASTGAHVATSLQMAQTRYSVEDLVLFYRAPVTLAWHSTCDRIHALDQCPNGQHGYWN